MKSFKDMVDEDQGIGLSARGEDFLTHVIDKPQEWQDNYIPDRWKDPTFNHLDEATLLDRKKDPKSRPVFDNPRHAILNHPALAETDNPHHVAHYQHLMAHGEELAGNIRNINTHIKNGYDAYSSTIKKGEDPRITQRAAQTQSNKILADAARDLGYGGKQRFLGRPEDNAKISKNSGQKLVGGNTKTEKNLKLGDITVGTALAPHSMHGVGDHTACVRSTSECRDGCLGFTTGKNAMLSNLNSKIAKHQTMIKHPEHFARRLHAELLNHIDSIAEYNKGKRQEKRVDASWRPNMTSDYPTHKWGRAIIDHVTDYAKSKGVTFRVRDYTKVAKRLNEPRAENHFLALSHTGSGHGQSNDHEVSQALDQGHTVASVVHGDATHVYDHKTKRLYPMVSGDNDDLIERRHHEVGHQVHADGTGSNKATGQKEGVVSVLRIKGISDKVKARAGRFVNYTTTIDHPQHGKMKVVEINKQHQHD